MSPASIIFLTPLRLPLTNTMENFVRKFRGLSSKNGWPTDVSSTMHEEFVCLPEIF
jgi:hypothetical protein